MSIQNPSPDTGSGVGRSLLWTCCWLSLLTAGICASVPAHGFSLQRVGPGAIRLRGDDISQNGVPLGGSTEQVFSQGTYQTQLNAFGQPLDIDIGASIAAAVLTASIDRSQTFVIRLTQAERNQCLTETDFDVDVRFVSPVDALAGQSGPGQLDVLDFQADYRDRQGGNCPSHLFYGVRLLLGLDSAVSAGTYAGTVEITVQENGSEGVETLQTDLEVEMPGLLLLYHPSHVQVDLHASAIASLLGAGRVCGGDGCVDLGTRTVSVSNLNVPITMDLVGAAPAVATLHTITLKDSIGVRATGCLTGSYDTAFYQVVGTTGGIQPGNGSIAGVQGAPCGLDLRTGDVSFDLDLGQAPSTGASATIQITVTGI